MPNKKNDSRGCANFGTIIIILLFLIPIWGLSGIMHDKSFIEGIGNSIGSWLIVIVIGAIGYGVLKSFNK